MGQRIREEKCKRWIVVGIVVGSCIQAISARITLYSRDNDNNKHYVFKADKALNGAWTVRCYAFNAIFDMCLKISASSIDHLSLWAASHRPFSSWYLQISNNTRRANNMHRLLKEIAGLSSVSMRRTWIDWCDFISHSLSFLIIRSRILILKIRRKWNSPHDPVLWPHRVWWLCTAHFRHK